MTEKRILPFGDPILRRTSEPVRQFDNELIRLLDAMRETLYAKEGRAGLAAPQIGASQRVIVMDCGDGLIELINPEIVEAQGEQIGEEACLSFPGYTGIVQRAQYVKITSQTREAGTIVIEGEGFLARCIQHEMDHLDGLLYIDRIQDGQLYEDETGRRVDLAEALRVSGKE